MKWKIFVSYRATQSMFVRQVTDQLISTGCEIWFAEYVTFDWRLRKDDTWLKSQISEGTTHSEWGIIFVSKDYMASADCRLELNQLLERRGPQRILQISLDGTRLAHLEKSGTIQCALEDVMEVVDFIAKRIGLEMTSPARPGRTLVGSSKRIRFGGKFTLDSYGWRRWWQGALDPTFRTLILNRIIFQFVDNIAFSKIGEGKWQYTQKLARCADRSIPRSTTEG